MFECKNGITTEAGAPLELHYSVIESKTNTGEGTFATFGIVCCAVSPDGAREEAVVLDIAPNMLFVESLAKTFCNGCLLPIHLYDLVLDTLI